MTETVPELPDRAEVDEAVKLVNDHAQRIFLWNYERSRGQLVTLYNKAMASQWNSVTELDWDTEVDPEELIDWDAPIMRLADEARRVDGSPIASWGEAELTQLGIESLKAQLSQFMHGEQGALICTAKIVETVPWIDAKYYASTQVMDEARHVEVFARTVLGFAHVFDTTFARELAHNLTSGTQPRYAEKAHVEMLPFIAWMKSPQH